MLTLLCAKAGGRFRDCLMEAAWILAYGWFMDLYFKNVPQKDQEHILTRFVCVWGSIYGFKVGLTLCVYKYVTWSTDVWTLHEHLDHVCMSFFASYALCIASMTKWQWRVDFPIKVVLCDINTCQLMRKNKENRRKKTFSVTIDDIQAWYQLCTFNVIHEHLISSLWILCLLL